MLTSTARLLKKVSNTSKVSVPAKTSCRSYADVPKDISGIKATLSPLTTCRTKEGPVEASKLLEKKKVVVVGVPGAFTPVCSSKHIPPFVEHIKDFKAKGVDEVMVVSVNDHHVMNAWETSLDAGGKVKFYADPNGEFTRGVHQEVDLTAGGLGKRSQRYSFYSDNGKVVHQMVEKSPGDLTESTAEAMLAALKK